MNQHGQKGGYQKRKRKVCHFCQQKINHADFKDIELLKKMVTDRGKLLPRRVTGNCALHQRVVATAVKRARHMALLPFIKE